MTRPRSAKASRPSFSSARQHQTGPERQHGHLDIRHHRRHLRQFGADLASVLDDGNNLRVLPIVGRARCKASPIFCFFRASTSGSCGPTRSTISRERASPRTSRTIHLCDQALNEEMHVIASKSIRNLRDLNSKTISVDLPNGGTFVTALTVFERLGMKPKVVYIEQRIALEKLKAGEIDAVIVCGGKPYKSVSGFKDDRFHLVTVDYEKPLQGDYLPPGLRQGLSQPDFRSGAGRHHRGAGGAGGL